MSLAAHNPKVFSVILFGSISIWNVLVIASLLVGLPVGGVVAICGPASVFLSREPWWAGFLLGIPFGIAAVLPAFVLQDLTDSLWRLVLRLEFAIPGMMAVLLVSAFPVSALAFWPWRTRSEAQ